MCPEYGTVGINGLKEQKQNWTRRTGPYYFLAAEKTAHQQNKTTRIIYIWDGGYEWVKRTETELDEKNRSILFPGGLKNSPSTKRNKKITRII